jgi:hypothetical protein
MISLWPPYNRLQRLPEDEDAYCMNTARLLKTDLGYLDYVLVPVMVIFPGLVG